EGEAAGGAAEQRLEAGLVWRERGPGMVPGHAVDPARDRVGLVPAQDHSLGLRLSVNEVVGITEARHTGRKLVSGNRTQGGVLMVDRRRDHMGAGHGRDLRRPDAGGYDDDVGFDPASLRDDGLDG